MIKKIIKLGELEINLISLKKFLVEAKRNGYAGDGKRSRLDDQSKIYKFHKGNFYYEDIYSGSCQAPGFEIVRWKNRKGPWIWLMSFSGGMVPEFWKNRPLTEETYSFLKDSLLKVKPSCPFRGPNKYENENFKYTMQVNGNFQKFSGSEQIINKSLNKIVFSQDFIGGLIVPKIK